MDGKGNTYPQRSSFGMSLALMIDARRDHVAFGSFLEFDVGARTESLMLLMPHDGVSLSAICRWDLRIHAACTFLSLAHAEADVACSDISLADAIAESDPVLSVEHREASDASSAISISLIRSSRFSITPAPSFSEQGRGLPVAIAEDNLD